MFDPIIFKKPGGSTNNNRGGSDEYESCTVEGCPIPPGYEPETSDPMPQGVTADAEFQEPPVWTLFVPFVAVVVVAGLAWLLWKKG